MVQQTLAHPFVIEGAGIHTGRTTRVTVYPADAGTGRVFQIGTVAVPARAEFVVDSARCTTLGVDGARVSTVEHLLSALSGLGVDNARMVVDGPEIPILDGSAKPFVEAIVAAGLRAQGVEARRITLTEPLEVVEGESSLRAVPAEAFEIEVRTAFAEWPEGFATVTATIAPETAENYAIEIAPARTFAFRREVEMLLAAGLAQGGSLDNALIITPPDAFSTPLRLPKEWCVHKLLDVIGDLALLDARPAFRLTAVRPGHRLNTRFANAILARARA